MNNVKEIRSLIKSRLGYNSREVSVKSPKYYGVTFTIQSNSVNVAKFMNFAESEFDFKFDIDYSDEVKSEISSRYAEKVTDAITQLKSVPGDTLVELENFRLYLSEYDNRVVDVRYNDVSGEYITSEQYLDQKSLSFFLGITRMKQDFELKNTDIIVASGEDYIKRFEERKCQLVSVHKTDWEIIYTLQYEDGETESVRGQHFLACWEKIRDYNSRINEESERADAIESERLRWVQNSMDELTIEPSSSPVTETYYESKINTLSEIENSNTRKVEEVGILKMNDSQYTLYCEELLVGLKCLEQLNLDIYSTYVTSKKLSDLSQKERTIWIKNSIAEVIKVLNIDTLEYFFISNEGYSYARYVHIEIRAVNNQVPGQDSDI